jgi:hypothetical protein
MLLYCGKNYLKWIKPRMKLSVFQGPGMKFEGSAPENGNLQNRFDPLRGMKPGIGMARVMGAAMSEAGRGRARPGEASSPAEHFSGIISSLASKHDSQCFSPHITCLTPRQRGR